jgi:hypothetical protein
VRNKISQRIFSSFHRNVKITKETFFMAASNWGSKIFIFGQQLRYFFGQQELFIMASQIIFFWAAKLVNGQQLFLLHNFTEKKIF